MGSVLEELAAFRTVAEMTEAFHDEARCRRLVEAMVWPNGRLCPACGSRRSIKRPPISTALTSSRGIKRNV